jgi:Flp pilus assembly protein TadD
LLGSLYWRQGKLDQAESALMRAVKFVTPLERRQLASQFQQIGDGFKKAGRSENAARAYRQAKALENEGRLVASIR